MFQRPVEMSEGNQRNCRHCRFEHTKQDNVTLQQPHSRVYSDFDARMSA
jgi:hypothetical protein